MGSIADGGNRKSEREDDRGPCLSSMVQGRGVIGIRISLLPREPASIDFAGISARRANRDCAEYRRQQKHCRLCRISNRDSRTALHRPSSGMVGGTLMRPVC